MKATYCLLERAHACELYLFWVRFVITTEPGVESAAFWSRVRRLTDKPARQARLRHCVIKLHPPSPAVSANFHGDDPKWPLPVQRWAAEHHVAMVSGGELTSLGPEAYAGFQPIEEAAIPHSYCPFISPLTPSPSSSFPLPILYPFSLNYNKSIWGLAAL